MSVFKRFVSCVILLSMLLVAIFCATNLFEKKDSDTKYNKFFEHSRDFDVLFFGSSHVINGVYPMELWDDYGFTSYNFGGHSSQIATSYWVLKNALDYAKPKVVVIDCFEVSFQQKTSNNFSFVHMALDTFPLSNNKIKAAYDLLDDKEMQKKIKNYEIEEKEKRTILGILWDYSVYHSRWEEIDKADFELTENLEYGAESRICIAQPGTITENSGKKLTEETVGIKYLKKMIEECKTEGIEVILTYLPYPITGEFEWTEINTLYDLSKEYDVDFLDFMSMNIVDYSTDCCDPSSHLNPSGALKVTNYLGEFLKNNYHIQDHRNNLLYDYWNEDYKKYEKLKNVRLSMVDDLNTYLMLLEDKNYGYIMNIGDNSIFSDETTIKLLKNKGVNIENISENTKHIIICGDNIEIINTNINENGDYGKIRIHFNDNNTFSIYKSDQEVLNLETSALSIIDGAICVNAFDIDDYHTISDISYFKVPLASGLGGRIPNNEGVVILDSKAIRFY